MCYTLTISIISAQRNPRCLLTKRNKSSKGFVYSVISKGILYKFLFWVEFTVQGIPRHHWEKNILLRWHYT